MSHGTVDLCMQLIENNFSKAHSDIASQLSCSYNGLTLSHLVNQNIKMYTVDKIKRILAELIKFSIVEYDNDSSKCLYKFMVRNAECLLWGVNFLYFVELKYGEVSKKIIGYLLNHGSSSVIDIFKFLSTENIDFMVLTEAFTSLSNQQIFTYHSCYFKNVRDDDSESRNIHIDANILHSLRIALQETDRIPLKRSHEEACTENLTEVQFADRVICIDFLSLSILAQNKLVKEYVLNKYDNIASSIVSVMLEYKKQTREMNSMLSYQIPFFQLLRELSTFNISEETLRAYLSILSSDSGKHLIKKLGESDSGLYSVDLLRVLKESVVGVLSSIVTQKYGRNAGRICNMLVLKKYMDARQISQLCLIDVADVHLIIQKLLSDQYIEITLVPKGIEVRPLKSISIISININRVATLLMNNCVDYLLKLNNLKQKLKDDNKLVLDKGTQMETLLNNLKNKRNDSSNLESDELKQVFSLVSVNEKKTLDDLKIKFSKIDVLVYRLAEQYFILKCFVGFITSV